jgi:hypothetical protein
LLNSVLFPRRQGHPVAIEEVAVGEERLGVAEPIVVGIVAGWQEPVVVLEWTAAVIDWNFPTAIDWPDEVVAVANEVVVVGGDSTRLLSDLPRSSFVADYSGE